MEAIKDYIHARDAFRSGDTGEAERLLAQALGIPELTPFMKENLEPILDCNDAALTIVSKRIKEDE